MGGIPCKLDLTIQVLPLDMFELDLTVQGPASPLWTVGVRTGCILLTVYEITMLEV